MSSKQVSHLPVNDNSNGWRPQRTPKASLEGSQTTDWVVIGAGFAGLAAARRLAENRPDDKIILLDAGETGENASGRNSGFAIDLPHVVGSSMDELEGSHRYMALARAAIDYHETQIERHAIDCDWSQPGKYQTASSEQGVREMLEPTPGHVAFQGGGLHPGVSTAQSGGAGARARRYSAGKCSAL
jgi:choline dehydrogenase-like flavoprotein